MPQVNCSSWFKMGFLFFLILSLSVSYFHYSYFSNSNMLCSMLVPNFSFIFLL